MISRYFENQWIGIKFLTFIDSLLKYLYFYQYFYLLIANRQLDNNWNEEKFLLKKMFSSLINQKWDKKKYFKIKYYCQGKLNKNGTI